jgi:hypothetical protein
MAEQPPRAAPPQPSADGRWWWDGEKWIPIPQATPVQQPKASLDQMPPVRAGQSSTDRRPLRNAAIGVGALIALVLTIALVSALSYHPLPTSPVADATRAPVTELQTPASHVTAQSSLPSRAPSAAPQQSTQPKAGTTDIHGTIYWPDGAVAANVPDSFWETDMANAYGRTDRAGRYSTDLCSAFYQCEVFQGWLHVPITKQWGNGCDIPLIPLNGKSPNGFAAYPGDTIDFKIAAQPCMSTPFRGLPVYAPGGVVNPTWQQVRALLAANPDSVNP